jgi:hypothetical protein
LVYFTAKQYKYALPPVEIRFGWLQPLLACAEFHDALPPPGAIEVADLRRARRVARPVVAGAILTGRERNSARSRARQDVVLVQRLSIRAHIARSEHRRRLLRQRRGLAKVAAELCELDRVPVQMRDVPRNDASARVRPRARSDAVACVDGVRSLCAQVSMPHVVSRSWLTRRSGELLTVGVSTLETAEVGAIADGRAGHEEAHGRRRFRALLCG